MNISIEEFVDLSQQSSNQSYQQFKRLLSELEQPKTRDKARDFLDGIQDYLQKERIKPNNFQFLTQNVLDENDQNICLRLLQFPSTFLPEAWSFTFYEGLIRYPLDEYRHKKLTELGCGIGWISIALALRYSPAHIYGLDINPKAIVCARLNLYLNAFDSQGELKILSNGQSLIDVVSFYESNLFSHFDHQSITFDKIVGCIPQVLNPEPEVMESLIAETSTDEYLHSLSNYSVRQGFIEDQFGLGLIARAVEQSIPLLHPNGKMILNLGGRPGRQVLERLMQRRGFEVRRIWQTQVEQAADTEIGALVDIEKNTGHRFEFYMSSNVDMPIDARVAEKYARAGGKIYHSVDVYEASLLFPEQVKSIYASIDQLESSQDKTQPLLPGQGLRSAIDLTYDNYDDAEERYSFLAFLAKQLQKTNHFAYQDTAGLVFFRQQIAAYFRYYLRVDVTEKQIIITPGRRQLIQSLLTNYQPRLTLVAKPLASLVASRFDQPDCEVIYAPPRVEFLVELIDKLSPQLVITSLDLNEVQSSQLVKALVQKAVAKNILLVIDLTENIDLSSEPDIHGVYRYLSENALHGNLILMAGLINNRVYQNYSVNITLTSNPKIAKNLIDAAELTYSRTPYLKQLYYGHLLEALLFFQRTRPTQVVEKSTSNRSAVVELPLHPIVQAAFEHPAVARNHQNFNIDTIRLDFGENELAAPEQLKQAIFESYLLRKWVTDDLSTEESLQSLLAHRFNIPRGIYSKTILGNGVAPLFSALLNICKSQQKSLVIPSGSYGYFKAAARYKNIEVNCLVTDESEEFKITPQKLRDSVAQTPGCWLFLNAPLVNPTGAIYSSDELKALLTVAKEYQVTVIMDCIFMGLEFDPELRWELSEVFKQEYSQLVFLGGISKEFSAGGLRFGYAWSTSKQLMNELATELTHQPHFTVKYAVNRLIELLLGQDQRLHAHLMTQRKVLKSRAQRMTQILNKKGWKVLTPSGGLFLVAKPEKHMLQQSLSPTEAADLIAEQLFTQQNVAINNSTWTGLPGYCRFVLSCSDQAFEQALIRIEKF